MYVQRTSAVNNAEVDRGMVPGSKFKADEIVKSIRLRHFVIPAKPIRAEAGSGNPGVLHGYGLPPESITA